MTTLLFAPLAYAASPMSGDAQMWMILVWTWGIATFECIGIVLLPRLVRKLKCRCWIIIMEKDRTKEKAFVLSFCH